MFQYAERLFVLSKSNGAKKAHLEKEIIFQSFLISLIWLDI